jgi:hypothetical protein
MLIVFSSHSLLFGYSIHHTNSQGKTRRRKWLFANNNKKGLEDGYGFLFLSDKPMVKLFMAISNLRLASGQKGHFA